MQLQFGNAKFRYFCNFFFVDIYITDDKYKITDKQINTR